MGWTSRCLWGPSSCRYSVCGGCRFLSAEFKGERAREGSIVQGAWFTGIAVVFCMQIMISRGAVWCYEAVGWEPSRRRAVDFWRWLSGAESSVIFGELCCGCLLEVGVGASLPKAVAIQPNLLSMVSKQNHFTAV